MGKNVETGTGLGDHYPQPNPAGAMLADMWLKSKRRREAGSHEDARPKATKTRGGNRKGANKKP